MDEHLREFAGLPVTEFGDDASSDNPQSTAWAVRTCHEGDAFDRVFERFLGAVDTRAVTHMVLGYWGAEYQKNLADPVELLVNASPRLPALRAVFLGDITFAEVADISLINQCDITPLLAAFGDLERLEVRGYKGFALSPVSASALKVLRFEAYGLPASVVRAVGASDLPNLQTLEMWLGSPDHVSDATVADLDGILVGERLPALRRLGLFFSEMHDEICAALATAPVVARLTDLQLTLGALTDDGAEALLSGQPLTHLRILDLGENHMTGPMLSRLRAALPHARLDAEWPEGDDEEFSSFR